MVCMKGMEHSLVIVVTAIVVLIVAVVLITIFTGGLRNVTPIFEKSNLCRQEAILSCRTTGKMPPAWDIQFKVIDERGNEVLQSCSGLVSGDCASILGGGGI